LSKYGVDEKTQGYPASFAEVIKALIEAGVDICQLVLNQQRNAEEEFELDDDGEDQVLNPNSDYNYVFAQHCLALFATE